MKLLVNRFPKRLFMVLVGAGALLLFAGCENASVGIGVSNFNSSTGMGYSFGVSRGPYGNTNTSFGLSLHGRL